MTYNVTDREDKDRENPVIDTFETREIAEQYAREWSADYGHCTVEDETGHVVSTFDGGKQI